MLKARPTRVRESSSTTMSAPNSTCRLQRLDHDLRQVQVLLTVLSLDEA